jgi:transposase InsO family protein
MQARRRAGLRSFPGDQVRRMKELETVNQRLRKAIADLTLDKLILQEAASSSLPRGTLRCVERCCPSARQARRSETVSTVAALLRAAGWLVNDKRVERLWDGDGSCVRLRPEQCLELARYPDRQALAGELVDDVQQADLATVMRARLLLRAAGWLVNDKRVERLWRQEGLKVPARQPKKGRLSWADGPVPSAPPAATAAPPACR